MNLDFYITHFTQNKSVVSGLAKGISDEQARWRPSANDWSILEVINHLYDEEREDFRARIRLTLDNPAAEWAPIDPAGWVTTRKYNERDLKHSLDQWASERDESLKWLKTIKGASVKWSNASQHPSGITLSAADLLISWLAHDHLHIRQLNEVHYLYLKHTTTPANIGYAGDW
jgi:uncharacterized damage-inducible protein DinB